MFSRYHFECRTGQVVPKGIAHYLIYVECEVYFCGDFNLSTKATQHQIKLICENLGTSDLRIINKKYIPEASIKLV